MDHFNSFPVLNDIKTIYIINEYSHKIGKIGKVISIGEVPININGVGILFKQQFKDNYFDSIIKSHKMQTLTESNKPGHAYRTGIYLTDVSGSSYKAENTFAAALSRILDIALKTSFVIFLFIDLAIGLTLNFVEGLAFIATNIGVLK